MRFFRGITIGIASLVCVFSITACIWLVTLQATLLNPNVTKGWLQNSGVYSKAIDSFIQTTPNQDNAILTPGVTKQALKSTFTPTYIQSQTEHTLDSVYAWIEGKTPTISFSIPINDKKTTFQQQLAMSIEPSVEQLPICSPTSQMSQTQVTCRPASKSVTDFTNELASQAVSNSGVLSAPITQQTILSETQESPSQASHTEFLSQLPVYYAWIGKLVVILPALVLLCLIIIFFAATDRLLAFARLSRRTFFSTAINGLAGLILLYVATRLTTIPGVVANGQNTNLVVALLPIAQRILTSIGGQVATLSGIAAGCSLIAWIVLQTIHHKSRLASKVSEPSHYEEPVQQTPTPPIPMA